MINIFCVYTTQNYHKEVIAQNYFAFILHYIENKAD